MCGGMSVGLWQCPPSCYRAGADNNSCWELHVSTLLLLVVITLLLGTSTPPNTESRSLSFIIISMKRRDSWLVWMSPSHLKNANLAILWILSTPLNITWMLPRVLLTSSTNILQDHSKYHFGSKYTVHDITYSKSGLEIIKSNILFDCGVLWSLRTRQHLQISKLDRFKQFKQFSWITLSRRNMNQRIGFVWTVKSTLSVRKVLAL